MSNSVFGYAVFVGYLGVDKHGRHLGAQEEIKFCLYALVALLKDRETHSFLYSFLEVSVISPFFSHLEISMAIAHLVTESPLSMRLVRSSARVNSVGRSSKSTLLWLRLPCSSICVCMIRKLVTKNMCKS